MMLIMVSMGAKADVKVLFGEKGDDKVKTDGDKIEATYDGGTIVVTQKAVDANTVTVYLIVTPNKGYSMKEKDAIEAYATAPANINPTRAPQASEKLTLDCKDFKDEYSTRTYYVDIDPALALWVKSADFKFQDGGRKGDGDPNFYYINNQRLPDDGYYFVPTINCFYGDNEDQPHLTTFKTGKDKNSIWRIEAVSIETNGVTKTYYRIIHNATGKYLMANTAITELKNANAAHRKRVHLETLSAQDLVNLNSNPETDKSLFVFTEIDADNNIIAIKSKNIGSKTNGEGSDHLYLNPRGNSGTEFDSYRAADGRAITNVNGTVGFWGNDNSSQPSIANQPGSCWKLETANATCANPVIQYTDASTIQISYPISSDSGWTIYYTTDDSDPSDNANTNRTAITSTATISATGVSKVRAIATKTGWNPSDESFLITSGITRLVQSKHCGAFYMVPPIVEGETYATTSNIPNAAMGWQFVPAGLYCGIQYYYVINNSTNTYLYCKQETGKDEAFIMKAEGELSSSEQIDRAKFRLIAQADGSYKIVSKWWAAEKPEAANYLNKKNGNNGTNPLNLADGTSNMGQWNVIAAPTIPKKQFDNSFASSSTTYKYYKIQNVNSTHNVIPPTTSGGNATASNSATGNVTLWYIVPTSDGDSWTEYYNIRNESTGEYLYFNGAAGAGNTFYASRSIVSGNENQYKFIIVKGANATYPNAYNIIPYALKDQANQANNSLNRNNTTLRTQNSRNTDNSLWNLVLQSPFNCATPEITWSAGDGGYIITTTEPDAKIYYMIGEGTLTPSTETLYTGAISVAELSGTTATIRAIVARSNDGSDKSPEASVTVSKVEIPVVTLTEDGKVQLTCETEGSRIYYEIGNTAESVNTPTTTNSSLYSGLIENAAGKYIKAIAVKEGWINSDIATSSQIVFSCATPIVKKTSATTFTIECNFPASGVTIRYNMGKNPTDPTSSTGTIYSGAVSFSVEDLPFIVKAIAVATNYNNSVVAEQELTKDLTPDTDGYYEIGNDDDFATFITMANGLASNGKYKITANIDAAGSSAISTTFKGELKGIAKADGTYPVISNLDHPIFNTIEDGLVKNVILQDVTISQVGNVGAIAGKASGYTRIYNCGILPSDNKFEASTQSSVKSTDGYCGGLIGWLKDDSRVINCFSYANITGGTDVAGIVGHNEAVYSDENGSYGSTTEVYDGKYYRLKTAVVNCMFYGNITSGSNRWPVYGGAKMVNNTATGINNYDFYRAEASLGLADNNHYNCSFPAKEEYLTQYEYYRYLLNSNRELCGWWVGADNAPSGMTTAQVQAVAKDASLIAKWVLDPSIAPYPILKSPGKYPSVINQSPEPATTATSAASGKRIDKSTKNWVDRASFSNTKMVNPKAAPETDGRILGTIKVNISNGSNSQTRYCAITAMDIDNNDFCYGKIQLPYYNSIFGDPDGTTWATKYGGNYTDNVVVGWTISSPTGTIPSESDNSGTDENGIPYDHTYSTNSESGYNFADRYCTTKDENRVFAQGGYYYVPYGVSEITITAKWAAAIYLDNGADHSYDRVYMSNSNAGTDFAPAGHRPTSLGNGKTVQTASISSHISSNGRVYDYAIVLVGNHQYRVGNNSINTTNGRTIISADFDLDDEPDNCLIWQLGQGTDRYHISPIRFDFLPVVEMGLAMKEDGSTQYYSLGCYRPRGHFEVTETSLIHFGQFEFGNKDRSIVAPLILNGGIFDQYCKGTLSAAPNATNGDYINYIILGGNVRMPSFTPGAHVREASNWATFHCPVSVMGGNIDYLYLTGNFNDKVTPNDDNPHCYIDGGNYEQVAAAAKEGINGNVTFKVNHSIIKEFYGGSTLADKLVTGNIDVTIDNSKVTKYCGGPKFGNMNLDDNNPENNKTIITNATGTTFDVFYGGGNGGTSYLQYTTTDKTVPDASGAYDWESSSWGNLQSYSPGVYYKKATTDTKGIGYKADYEMEIVNSSAGTDENKAIFRTYFYAAQFSATNTGPISNYLTNCKVLTNFYGGGNLGGVKGDVSSILTDTEVQGSAFGAGYSASVPEVTIYNKNKTAPTINVYTGIITPTPDPDPSSTSSTYTWTNDPSLSTSSPKSSDGQYFFTEEPLGNLGTITGNIYLTIKGNTTIVGKVFNKNGTQDATKTGGVYGGGDESAVNGSTQVNLQGNVTVNGNVFGGGNNGHVSGSATVNIE